jgi:transcriptional regulator of heat shock response
MVKVVDYESRRRAILSATINKYISGGVPVASDEIACDFDLSSATVRNIFSELEKAGYLTHPHTSGGRVPTSKGYRYYVDFLISQIDLLDEEKERVVKGYKIEIKQLEDVLEKTSEVISVITHHAGIVSFLEWQDKLFYKGISYVLSQPEFQNLERIRFLIKIIEDKQRLLNIINQSFSDKIKIYIGEELGCEEIDGCSLVVATYQVRKKPVGRLAVLGPKRMEYNHIIPALEYIAGVLTDVLDDL